MTTAYQASFDMLGNRSQVCTLFERHRFVFDDVETALLPILTGSKDTTDDHLVTLAKRRGLKLATLDKTLMIKPQTVSVSDNPLIQPGH